MRTWIGASGSFFPLLSYASSVTNSIAGARIGVWVEMIAGMRCAGYSRIVTPSPINFALVSTRIGA
jgi:hypothetical protein